MLFNSFPFIFVFLPFAFAGYFLISHLTAANLPRLLWLTAASFAFYGYWNIEFVPVMAASIAANYGAGRAISAAPPSTRTRHLLFAGAIAANLAALFFYKYMALFIGIAASLLHRNIGMAAVTLPLGISFFTFTQIAYLADVYRGYPSERNAIKYALFVSYFPHLIAGPILHHKEMMWQFDDQSRRRLSPERVALGLAAFTIGLFKKAVIADGFATLAAPVFDSTAGGVPPFADAWVGALAYSLQIYFDFSGYSDMALGLSTMFGITLPFNFDSPYKARSIVDFWRRWHITLSRFLRDYLYIPLGGNRLGKARRYANLFATMMLGGLWHGAGFTFLLWGGLHGIFLCVNHAWHGLRKRVPWLDRLAGTALFPLFALALTQVAVVVAWVVFRADKIKVARRMLAAMFGLQESSAPASFADPRLMLLFVLVGYAWCLVLPNLNEVFGRQGLGLDTYRMPRTWSLFSINGSLSAVWGTGLGLLTVVSLLAILKSGSGTPFLYFQF